MKYKVAGWLLMTAVIGTICESSSFAVPYVWNSRRVQDLADVTASFHGPPGQLSTINSITPIPNGIELDVTFRAGQNVDPFAPDYGITFARVSLADGLWFPGLNLSAFTSSQFSVTTTTDVTVQSFVQTDFTENGGSIDDGDANPGEVKSFLFWEHNDGAATGGPTVVDFDFASGTEFDGDSTSPDTWNGANPKPVQGTGTIRAWGLQLAKFSGMVVGQPVNATIRIEGVVPEPATLGLVCIAMFGLVGFGRRRG
jgi:hypothetical protein